VVDLQPPKRTRIMNGPMRSKVMRDMEFSSFFPSNVEYLDEMPSSSSCGI
jgi:hypothetical protein